MSQADAPERRQTRWLKKNREGRKEEENSQNLEKAAEKENRETTKDQPQNSPVIDAEKTIM